MKECKMQDYYEKRLTQAKLAKRLIRNGIRQILFDGAANNPFGLRSEDLFLYGEVLKDAEYSVEIAEKALKESTTTQSCSYETELKK